MKSIFRTLALFVTAFLALLVVQSIFNRKTGYKPKDPELFARIQHMDSALFDAFNAQKIGVLKDLFSDSLEFYHDISGVSDYSANIAGFGRLFAANAANPLKRQLLAGTMEVYAIPGYGAVEMGVHRFIHKENGKDVVGLYKFVHTWQFKNGQWKVSRVVSVGH